jgi:Holliday junction DNA helicase RuvA
MIAALAGTLVTKTPQSALIDVHGVGYEVFTSVQTYYRLPDLKQSVRLHTYTHVREDALVLYGFLSSEEKAAFLLLISVSGVGPRLGLALLSGLTVTELASAIRTGDARRLSSVPGIGQKTAARLILELQSKITSIAPETTDNGVGPVLSSTLEDALSALVNLGYQTASARETLKQIERTRPGEDLPVEDLLREALRRLSK